MPESRVTAQQKKAVAERANGHAPSLISNDKSDRLP